MWTHSYRVHIPCCSLSYLLCVSHARVGHLDMQHCADGGRNVYDTCGLNGAALLYVPSVENEWNMSVVRVPLAMAGTLIIGADRKSTRLNSSHANISYAVFCLKKKNKNTLHNIPTHYLH